MSPKTQAHPDPHTLSAFARGELSPAELAEVAGHVQGNSAPRCRPGSQSCSTS